MDLLFDSAMESINRNERVIQLLKRLNLDPDHPPADFEAVYKYALVEYGVGKPRPALEIFRQTKIQELFREALERNNPSILLKNGEDFLADSPLQADLQASNVDVRREFYAFAAVFIEVAKRTRTPAEILAEQKLESLHRQIGSLQERLNRLPTIEGLRTEMARLAAPSYPALPGSEPFNAEQCKAFALAQQMRGWFETLGFDLESHEVWQDDYFEWIINIPVRRGRYDRILVRGIDGEAGLSDVEDLKQSVETHRTDEGWLVTARRISRAARDAVEKAENEGLGCYTLDELLDQDADFSGYLTWLETEIQKRGIDQKYVPLACLKEEIDPDTQQRIGVSRYDDRDGWIDGYIDLWLDDPAKEHISVLGEFGTGKTWFALHYAWKALQRYREAQRRGLERPRLPLVIPLRDYAKAVSVESLFSEFFFRKHEIPIPGYSAFEQLNRIGKLLLIFDGFDEMAARVDRQEMINNFWELAKVVVPGAKVILTCRTEHFPDAKEGRALLNAELQASTRDLTGETPQFEVLELEKFNDEQIRQVLEHQAQPATVEQIMGNPQLLDLARRPVLTELILEALPDIEAGKPVDMSRVYLYAVRHKMERDIKAERTFTSMADKLYFMCELSWEMLSTDRMSINYREFPDRIRKLFGPAVQEQKDLDHWHYDMMGQTMLIRNAQGDYSPAHRSLLEFFVAYKIVASLGVMAKDFTVISRQQPLLDKLAVPQKYTWNEYFQRSYNNEGIPKTIAPLESFKRSKFDELMPLLGMSTLAKALLDLAHLMIDEKAIKKCLLPLLWSTRNKTVREVGYLGGNVAQLMVAKNPHILAGVDLSGTKLRGANFSQAYLRRINFRGAYLKDVQLTKAFGTVYSVAFDSSGELLAIGDSRGLVQVWNTKKRRIDIFCSGHTQSVNSVAFNPNDKVLASGSYDNTIKIWAADTGECLKTLEGHSGRVLSVEFSPDGKTLVSGSADGTVRLWSTETGKCLQIFEGHSDWIWSVLYIPNSKKIASGSADGTIRLWSTETEKCTKTIRDLSKHVWAIAVSPDGRFLASGNDDKTVRLWSIETGNCLSCFEGHLDGVWSVAFSLDGKALLSGCFDNTIKMWSLDTGECLQTLKNHSGRVWSVKFAPDSKVLASGSADNTVKLWSVKTGECLQTLEGYSSEVRSIACSPNGKAIASGSYDSTVKLWSLETGTCLKTIEGHSSLVNSVAFSPDGKILVSGSYDSTVKLWSLQTGKCLATLCGHADHVQGVAFSSDNKTIASISKDEVVRIWLVRTGECIRVLKGRSNRLTGVVLAFSPDGKTLALSSRDDSIKLWSLETGDCVKTLKGHEKWVLSVAFSPDGRTIASGSYDSTVKLWSLETGYCLRVYKGHRAMATSVAFSPDGQTIASGSYDNTVKLWSLETGYCSRTFEGHKNGILSVAFAHK